MHKFLEGAIPATCLDDITNLGVYYIAGNTWLRINYKGGGYELERGYVEGGNNLFDFEYLGNFVKTWKTFKGVINFIRNEAYKENKQYVSFVTEKDLELIKNRNQREIEKRKQNYLKELAEYEKLVEKRNNVFAQFLTDKLEMSKDEIHHVKHTSWVNFEIDGYLVEIRIQEP